VLYADFPAGVACRTSHFLGTISFALCAMTAHKLGFASISLIAGGGRH
jgi:hypothetical protein